MGANRLKFAVTAGLLLLVAACVETPKPPVGPTPVPPPINNGDKPEPEPQPIPKSDRLSALPGWETSDAFIALEAVRGTCAYKKGRQYSKSCEDLKGKSFESPEEIKAWLLTRFRIERLEGEGLLTAYFVPEYPATTVATTEFSQPVRERPDDLVLVDATQLSPPSAAGKKVAARKVGDLYVPYYTRAEIEAQPAPYARYFMRPEDYFFMQLQGSGYLTLEDGTRIMAAYAADNGQPFVGIAKTLTDRGILAKNQSSGDNIRKWLAENRGPVAQEVMNQNPRYAFFAIDTTRMEPLGAAAVPLPAGSAIAVDPLHHQYGDLYWLDADAGTLKDSFPVYQRMVSALDTGGAIKGKIRADLYIGHGDRAGQEAGRVKHTLRMWRIVPAE
ncbi:MltA domain-containing protein [Asticcacaulis sp. BYS171W]|uniref:peptidoglycan lytic exotransglycosylase n=1 Tax=Asticcacaulis aquaticus TaxID=2984212 RepID=A0ABT5HSU1_9CAUL|nr:MltA domain-containing protein [Asticcacaulis aquaticus]MDC7683064.1 MltA domain-containing protein [Asticcacaulis aquaticus]